MPTGSKQHRPNRPARLYTLDYHSMAACMTLAPHELPPHLRTFVMGSGKAARSMGPTLWTAQRTCPRQQRRHTAALVARPARRLTSRCGPSPGRLPCSSCVVRDTSSAQAAAHGSALRPMRRKPLASVGEDTSSDTPTLPLLHDACAAASASCGEGFMWRRGEEGRRAQQVELAGHTADDIFQPYGRK